MSDFDFGFSAVSTEEFEKSKIGQEIKSAFPDAQITNVEEE